MDENPRSKSILETLGDEIVRIIIPVSICMFLVLVLVSLLNGGDSDSNGLSITTMATVAYTENTSDSIWDKLKGAILNSLVFVAVVTVVTFFLVLLFYFRCTKFLKYYMGFSAFLVLSFMGGEIALLLIEDFSFPIDSITFVVLLFNFTIVGVLAVFMSKMAILITQSYLVAIGVLVAYWFTLLPEWTTWVLLIAMALYDLAAVLLPGGPLRLLVELAMSRDEDIPALVYEARPIIAIDTSGEGHRRVWRDPSIENRVVTSDTSSNSGLNSTLDTNLSTDFDENGSNLVDAEEGRQVSNEDSELVAPLIQHRIHVRTNDQTSTDQNLAIEGIGLGSSGAIKLGLGDFIFYSVLVGRAAMYDFMTVYACYLAIVAGLGITLILLAFYRKALPALPVSIFLGVLFYLLTRFLLEVFVVQCSMNLLMF